MRISEAGEFGLIDAVTRLINRTSNIKLPSWQNLLIGAGDDTAAWKPEKGIELATTDILVEGTHFDLSSISWRELGWKSITVNASDIAAMGGLPRYALVSLALPAQYLVEDVLEMYRGMVSICNSYGIAIAGGNVSSARQMSISVAMTGVCRHNPMVRSAAAAGDLIAVTGYPGLSAAGLKAVNSQINLSATAAKLFRKAHFQPLPQIEAGLALVSNGVRAAIDTSDGLLADLTHICQASKKSAVVFTPSIPVHPLLKRYFPHDCLSLALTGGEDYALLFTAGREAMSELQSSLKIPCSIIGEITAAKTGKITVLDKHGKPVASGTLGWDHYRR